jgi:hypothetical protein
MVVARRYRRCSVPSAHVAQLHQLCGSCAAGKTYAQVRANHHTHLQHYSKEGKARLPLCLKRHNLINYLITLCKSANSSNKYNYVAPTITYLQSQQLLVLSTLTSVILSMHYDPVIKVQLYTTAVPFLHVALLQPEQCYTPRWTSKTDHVLAYGCVISAILKRQPQKALRVAQDPLVLD